MPPPRRSYANGWRRRGTLDLSPTPPAQPPAIPLSAAQIVRRFVRSASPEARELARLLSAAPELKLPVMRTLQAQLLPGSEPLHLAEVRARPRVCCTPSSA